MHQPGLWSEITEGSTPLVPAFRALKHVPDVAHTFTDGQQHLAVHDASPYGELVSLPDEVSEHVGLMTPSGSGEGVTFFNVTEELIALDGLTFGTGRKRTELLHPLYQRIGRALTSLAQLPGLKPSLLGVEDFAYDRESDKLVLIPPVRFGNHTYSVEDYREHFVSSMIERFGHFLLPQSMASLAAEVAAGDEQ